MKAIRQHEFGGPEVLRYEDALIPGLKPGEVRVRVHAVGIKKQRLTPIFESSKSAGYGKFHRFRYDQQIQRLQ